MWRSLDGLSVGDAFGEQWGGAGVSRLPDRKLAPPPWRTTDDTEMALEICSLLAERGRIDQDELAVRFARRFRRRPDRGYGGGAMRLLNAIDLGRGWRSASRELFRAEGSKGNGAAMRVGPLGAFFAGDPDATVREARASSEVTHAHPDGVAGGIAVAVAAAHLGSGGAPDELLATVAENLDPGAVSEGIDRARRLGPDTMPWQAARELGNGTAALAEDTVPFCLWVASRFSDDYERALWATAEQSGDVDTTCAIVGGLVALSAPNIPATWLSAREALDSSR
jgi:ADP-ribosylglycohydrolase